MNGQINHVERLITKLTEDWPVGIAGPKCVEDILKVESALGLTFSRSYREFVLRFGAVIIGDSSFAGIWNTPFDEDSSGTHWHTTRCRSEYKLPSHFAVVSSDCGDEVLWCLDTLRMDSEGECPVVQFNIEDSSIDVVCNDFGTLISEYLEALLK